MIDNPINTKLSELRLSAPPDRSSIGHHSGPGLRLIFWVQGCRLRCTRNCLNPHLLKNDGGCLVEAEALTDAILRFADDYREVEGVTVLGGEPFEQAAALAEALAPVVARGLSLMVYSGHTLEALREMKDSGVDRLLGLCDIIVDGPFIDELYDESLIWRGSLNQRILRLSKRYTQADIDHAISRQARSIAISRGVRGDVTVSGTQNPDTSRELTRLMAKRG